MTELENFLKTLCGVSTCVCEGGLKPSAAWSLPPEAYREQHIHRHRRDTGGGHTGVCMHTHAHNDFLGNHVRVMKQKHVLLSAKLTGKPVPVNVPTDTASDSNG